MSYPKTAATLHRAVSVLLLGFASWALWHLTQANDAETIATEVERFEVDRSRLGHTKRTELVSVIMTALAARSAFIGANVDRTYTKSLGV